jgi:hypothetical protein
MTIRIPATQMLPKRDRDKLEKALCTLVDYEGDLAEAAGQLGIQVRIGDVCRALRLLVDGEV